MLQIQLKVSEDHMRPIFTTWSIGLKNF